MNKVTLMGRLGAAPDILQLSNGPVANLRIATNESYKDRNTGERKTITEWHRISIYVPFLVDRCKKLKTGDRVYIEGGLRTRAFTNKQDVQQNVTEIVIRPYHGTIEIMANTRTDDEATDGMPTDSAEVRTRPASPPQARPRDTYNAPSNTPQRRDPFEDDPIPF